MLVVGLGKQKGADAVHASGRTDVLGPMGDFLRANLPVLFGVAILENSYDETRDVAVVTPDKFTEYDIAWAKQSRSLMPKIPIRNLDLVIVDKMGKDVSGSGMDTNVIGFTRRLLATGQTAVPLAVLGLTDKTEGNAMGIGLADLTTRRLVEKIDYQKTYTNVLATGIYSTGRIPVTLENDKAILDAVIGKLEHPEKARIIRIQEHARARSVLGHGGAPRGDARAAGAGNRWRCWWRPALTKGEIWFPMLKTGNLQGVTANPGALCRGSLGRSEDPCR